MAMCRLATVYRSGVVWCSGVTAAGRSSGRRSMGDDGVVLLQRDVAEALRLYTAAAEDGYAAALFHLAVCKQHGEGAPCDPTAAVRLCKRAAEQGKHFANC